MKNVLWSVNKNAIIYRGNRVQGQSCNRVRSPYSKENSVTVLNLTETGGIAYCGRLLFLCVQKHILYLLARCEL